MSSEPLLPLGRLLKSAGAPSPRLNALPIYLLKLADLITQNSEELAQLEAYDTGKPLTNAKRKIWFAAEIYRYYAGWATKLTQWKKFRSLTPSRSPQMSEAQLNRVQSYVHDGAQAGAKILEGGKHVGERGYFYEPTVLINTTPVMNVEREEIFGPVLCALLEGRLMPARIWFDTSPR
jgi:acyl-CoA reductase-like NAD-dependent aldehyde dehydrogenase